MERNQKGNDIETLNILGHTLEENKQMYDTQVKIVLSNKLILAWIVKYTIEEFKDYSIEEIVKCIGNDLQVGKEAVYPGALARMDTNDQVIDEGTITYDIKFCIIKNTKERMKLIINIEAQKDFYPGYDLVTRGIFYCARMLSSQLGTEFTPKNYNNIKKVYSIWICMNPPNYAKNAIKKYSIKESNLFGEAKINCRHDLLSLVMIYLDVDEVSSNDGLNNFLSIILNDEITFKDKKNILENKYNLKVTEDLKGVEEMCNLSELVLEKGIEKGKINTFIDLILDGILTKEQVCEKTGMSLNEIEICIEEYLANIG